MCLHTLKEKALYRFCKALIVVHDVLQLGSIDSQHTGPGRSGLESLIMPCDPLVVQPSSSSTPVVGDSTGFKGNLGNRRLVRLIKNLESHAG